MHQKGKYMYTNIPWEGFAARIQTKSPDRLKRSFEEFLGNRVMVTIDGQECVVVFDTPLSQEVAMFLNVALQNHSAFPSLQECGQISLVEVMAVGCNNISRMHAYYELSLAHLPHVQVFDGNWHYRSGILYRYRQVSGPDQYEMIIDISRIDADTFTFISAIGELLSALVQ